MNRRPEAEVNQEMRDHGGQLAADSLDGRSVIGYANSYAEIYALVSSHNLQPHEVCVRHVDEVGIDEMF